jgi:hypothetical protein
MLPLIGLIFLLTGCMKITTEKALSRTKELTPEAKYYVLEDVRIRDSEATAILVETANGRRYLYVFFPQTPNSKVGTPEIYTFSELK